jgi:2-(1,2-epoxy-1,2-dihydrophenyl)acetyl-CoA isomerase
LSYSTLDFKISTGVAQITLNRPTANNSINLKLAEELNLAAIRCCDDPEIRAVLITGNGATFCPGGDLKSFAAIDGGISSHLKLLTTHLHSATTKFVRGDAPVIAAVNGVAAGAGMSLACAADITLAAKSARFTTAYTRVGLSPDGAMSYFLPRMVGLKRATELILSCRVISAAEAREIGIVSEVLPDNQLMDQALAMATRLAERPTRALGAAKRLILQGFDESLETQMEYETTSIAGLSETPESIQMIKDFLKTS